MKNIESLVLKPYSFFGFKISSLSQVKKERILFMGLLMSLLLPLEVAAAIVAWETNGQVFSAFLLAACLGVNIYALIFMQFRFWPNIIVITLFGLLLIWYEVPLAIRMHYVSAEAANIVSWAYSEKVKTGSYPKDLSSYIYVHPEYAEYIRDYGSASDSFVVTYSISSREVSHAYTSERGWSYYPD
jgi:hypothetical protein